MQGTVYDYTTNVGFISASSLVSLTATLARFSIQVQLHLTSFLIRTSSDPPTSTGPMRIKEPLAGLWMTDVEHIEQSSQQYSTIIFR